jgi:hypothetical protein
MSKDANSEFQVLDIRYYLSLTDGDQWSKLRSWLARYAPESPTRAAVERIVALNEEATVLIDALMERKMVDPGDHTANPPKRPRWTDPPLDAIAGWWGGDTVREEALEAIAAWQMPPELNKDAT